MQLGGIDMPEVAHWFHYCVVFTTDWEQGKVIVYLCMLYGYRSLLRRRVVADFCAVK